MVMRRDGSNRWARNNNWQFVNRHSTVTHYQRPTVTQLQEGGTGQGNRLKRGFPDGDT